MANRFKPGDVAVLKNDLGGRLYTVHTVDGEMVTERHRIASQQKYVRPVYCNELIWCKDAAYAEQLVGLLTATREKYNAEVSRLQHLRRQAYAALYAQASSTRGRVMTRRKQSGPIIANYYVVDHERCYRVCATPSRYVLMVMLKHKRVEQLLYRSKRRAREIVRLAEAKYGVEFKL